MSEHSRKFDEDREKQLDFLESQIPVLSSAAISLAYFKTLEAGGSVLAANHAGEIYKIFPDGTKEFIKKTDPYLKYRVGEKFFI